jgi:4'-phosphopantetheinyl transferase
MPLSRLDALPLPNKGMTSELGAERLFDGGALEVLLARLDVGPQALDELSQRLCPAELRRAARLRGAAECRRFIVARARLREVLAARLGVAPQALDFVYGLHGKPALAPRFAASRWRFNVAHCADVAVYALARDREVGIDVEAIRAFADADAVAERFFSPIEKRAYSALEPGAKPLGFFNCWTRKEAVVKAHGEGLRMPLDLFDVALAPNEPAALLRVDASLGARSRWYLESFSPLPGFVAAVATHSC